MRFKLITILFTLSILLLLSSNIYSQQLVYRPTNPSFGGNPLNGSFLLNSAQIQDKLTDGSETTASDPLADFRDNLGRQILNQLAKQVVDQTFGETGLEEGIFEVGDFLINITETGSGINIQILDQLTGNETTLFVPFL